MDNWKLVCTLGDIPRPGSRVVKSEKGDIALFRTGDDEVFALRDKCPHRGGPLSQGLVAGKTVTCPMHGWKVRLENGEAVEPDKGCCRTLPVRLEGDKVWLPV